MKLALLLFQFLGVTYIHSQVTTTINGDSSNAATIIGSAKIGIDKSENKTIINVFNKNRKKKTENSYYFSKKNRNLEKTKLVQTLINKYDITFVKKSAGSFLSLVSYSDNRKVIIENTYLPNIKGVYLKEIDLSFCNHKEIQFVSKQNKHFCSILLSKKSSTIRIYNEMLYRVDVMNSGTFAKITARWNYHHGSHKSQYMSYRSGYIDCDDNFRVKPIYKKIGFFNDKGNTYALTQQYVKHYGIIDTLGNEIIPFSSSYKEIQQTDGGYFLIRKNDDTLIVVNPSGEIISKGNLSFEEIGNGNYATNLQDKTIQIFNHLGYPISQKYLNIQKAMILEFEAGDTYIENSKYLIATKRNNKVVFTNLDGKPISEEYDLIEQSHSSDNYSPILTYFYKVKKNDKYGLLHVTEKRAIEIFPCTALSINKTTERITERIPIFKIEKENGVYEKIEYEHSNGRCVSRPFLEK